ncbi:MAG: M20/M25/M40 family metallo-hydrolase, partial [Longimicrobiales bacterium]
MCAVAMLCLLMTSPVFGQAVNEHGNPMKLAPRPTTRAITVEDMKTRLYIFADDSMQGRQTGREGNMKGTAYIARELARLGLQPAGDNGTFFQALPYVVRKFTPNSTLTVDGQALRWLEDWVATPGRVAPRPIDGAQVIYGGVAGDTVNQITREQAAGKLVVLSPAPPGAGRGGQGRGGGRGGGGRGGAGGVAARFAIAAGIATIDLNALTPRARALINNPAGALTQPNSPVPEAGPANLRITREAAAKLIGRSLDGLAPGTTGGKVTARLDFVEQPVPEYGRNVVAIVRGSDPALRGQYVAVGSHNDHVGFLANPVEHDSARAAATARLRLQMGAGELRELTQDETAGIRVNVDSLRRVRPARPDSIRNGADDDGSGSMAMLEIAEALAIAATKPRRSVIFVWHTGEEGGLSGSRWFVENPTVPRDSIVTQINMDMIGRGRATDIPGGGDDYLAVVGSSMLSTELGEMVKAVNQKQPKPFRLDYRFDSQTTWPGYNNIYGRSDHANYARRNIPIAFFFTGLHQYYHQVTDEPQYIDYPHYPAITRY